MVMPVSAGQCEARICLRGLSVCVLTISWVLERGGELLGGDSGHATLLLGFLSCSYRCLCFTLRMSRPETQITTKHNGLISI